MTGLLIGAVIGLALVVAALSWLLWQAFHDIRALQGRYGEPVYPKEWTPPTPESREVTPLIVETTPAQDLPEAEPGVQPSGMRTWRGHDASAEYPDPQFPTIHRAVWGATGTPDSPRVYDVPDAFWDEVANIHLPGSDMSP